jgi:hypothetical protein
MSETTRFKHPRPFPFCSIEAGEPTGPYDYIPLSSELTDPAGQSGLTRAMAIWWNLEEASFNVGIGTVVVPLDLGNVVLDVLGGSIVASDSVALGAPVPAAAPSARVCFSFENSYTQCPTIFDAIRSSDTYLNYAIRFELAYDSVSSEWRLYYYFGFEAIVDGFVIVNQSSEFPSDNPTWTELSSGTFEMMGETLPWVAYKSPSSMAESASLAGSTAYFTYPPP